MRQRPFCFAWTAPVVVLLVGWPAAATEPAEGRLVPPLSRVTDQASAAKRPDLGLKPITSVSVDIRSKDAKLPEDVAGEVFGEKNDLYVAAGHIRDWYASEFHWEAPAVAYSPLYFEDVNLERYGHHFRQLQPALSAAHFFARLPLLPYLHGARPCYRRYYSLGYGRPGEPVPYFIHLPPVSLLGATTQGAAATGLIFLIP